MDSCHCFLSKVEAQNLFHKKRLLESQCIYGPEASRYGWYLCFSSVCVAHQCDTAVV